MVTTAQLPIITQAAPAVAFILLGNMDLIGRNPEAFTAIPMMAIMDIGALGKTLG